MNVRWPPCDRGVFRMQCRCAPHPDGVDPAPATCDRATAPAGPGAGWRWRASARWRTARGRLLVLRRVGRLGVDRHPAGELVERGGERGEFCGAGGHRTIMAPSATSRPTGRPRWAGDRPPTRKGPCRESGSIDEPWPSVDSTSAASPATAASWPDALPRPVDEQDRSSDAVAAIIAEVRAGGDAALRALTARFDGVAIDELRVPAREIQAALAPHPAGAPGGARRRPRPDPGLPRPRGGRRARRLRVRGRRPCATWSDRWPGPAATRPGGGPATRRPC